MASQFKIPNLGDNVESGEVLSVAVKVGDMIRIDDPVAELETGKATIELPSEVEGKVTEVHIKAGDSVTPGQIALTIEPSGDASQEKPAPKAEKQEKKEPSDEAATPGKIEPDKPTRAPEPATAAPPATAAKAPAEPQKGSRVPVAAAPSVRKFAREIGVDISTVPGSGPSGRISIDDVKAYAKQRLTAAPTVSTGGSVAAPPLPDFSQWGPVEFEAMNNVRRMTAQHMALCWSVIPHVTQQDKADITDLERMRKRYAKRAEEAGGKLTLTAMLLKIVSAALKVYPQFNASVDLENRQVILKKYIHLGVAVNTPKGLVVPVVRDVDTKNIIELSIELNEIAGKARDGKLAPADMQGGTFTISNLGGIGGSYFTPIINHPEVAILGIGRGAQEPVYNGEEFVPRLMLPLSLSYDHRIIDGADGARFLRWIAEAIQEPLLVAMEG